MTSFDPKLSLTENARRNAQEELVRLQIVKLRRERNEFRPAQSTKSDTELLLLIGIVLAIVGSFFVFVIKYPKTFIFFLFLGYGALQFLAPVQGADFNHWVVTLVTNPTKARNELLATVSFSNTGSSTISSTGNDPQTVPVGPSAAAAPMASAVTVNPVCKTLNWSNSDDAPYLQYYKCPKTNTGN